MKIEFRFETFVVIVLAIMLLFTISCISPSKSITELNPEDPSIPNGETPEYAAAFNEARSYLESGNYSAAATKFASAYEIARTDIEKERCSIGVVSNLLRIPGVNPDDEQVKTWLAKAEKHATKSETLPELKVLKSFVNLADGRLSPDINDVTLYSSDILAITAGELYAYQALISFLSGDRVAASTKLSQALSLEPANPVVLKIASTLRSLGL